MTYEVSPGFQVTLQLVTIDIPATEKANHQPPGSFVRLLKSNQTGSTTSSELQSGGARRAITNKDLEPFASARRKSELAYERRRRELGLPSKEELQRQAKAAAVAERRKLEQSLTDQSAREGYWRERATTLRAEIAAVDAEIASLRQQLDSLPLSNIWSSVAVVSGFAPFVSVAPFAPFGRAVVNPVFQMRTSRPQVFAAPQRGPMSRINVGPVGFPNRGFHNRFPVSPFGTRRGFGIPFPFSPLLTTGGYQPYESIDQTILWTRLNELVAQRAGLQARWRALEDEARRNGAYPGWLRP